MFQTFLTESLKVKFDSEFVTYITYILASEPGGTLKTRCLFCCNWSSSLRMSTRRRLVMSEDEMSQMSQGAALPSLGFHGDLNVRQHVSLLKIFQRSKCTSSRTLPYFANTIWFLHSRSFHQGTGKVIIFPKLSRCQLQIFGEVSAIVKPISNSCLEKGA